MQTITTKYIGPTDTKGSRVSARSSSGAFRLSMHWDNSLNSEQNHAAAALALCAKAGWTGELVGGHTEPGMVWVFTGHQSPKICA